MILVPYLAYRITGHELGDHAYWGTLESPVAFVFWWIGLALLSLALIAYVMRELGPRPRRVEKDPTPQRDAHESFGPRASVRRFL
jgi:hypothetical protein